MKLSKAIEGFLLDYATKFTPLALKSHRDRTPVVLRYFGDVEIEDITLPDLNRFMGYLKYEHIPIRFKTSHRTGTLAPATIDNYWKLFRKLFQWANTELGIPRPDLGLPRPRYKTPEVSPFTQEEVKKMLYCAEWTKDITREGFKTYRVHKPKYLRDKSMILFLLDTGVRLGELCRAKIQDVNLSDGVVLVAPYSSGQKTTPRYVYLGQTAKKVLWHYLAMQSNPRPEDPIFGLSMKTTREILAKIAKQAGVLNCHPHRFRHTFAIEYIRNGGDPFTLQKLLGHSTLDMVRHYVNVVETDKRRMHDKASPADVWKL